MIIITAVGNAGRDAEHRGNDRGPATFSLAITRKDRGTEEKHTTWYDVVCFGILRERAMKVTKGARVFVMGREEIKTAQDGREYRSIVASELDVLKEGRAPEQREASPYDAPMDGHGRGDGPPAHDDEDVPF
jgi:single-stranded DNA-binding protein